MVVTYSILGDVVADLVGDAATVVVLVPNGQDPHDHAPSARDREQISEAALVVANGLDLEEGLEDTLATAADDGVPVFFATDHLTVRGVDVGERPDEAGGDEAGDAHGGGDPHIWTDPLAMAEMAPDLAGQLEMALGVPFDDRLATLLVELNDLDGAVRTVLEQVPAGSCVLVTGHDSLGYFASRYGCEVVGSIIPSLSSTAEASARDLAELLALVDERGVRAIFTELGTPAQVAEQVASEAGIPLVELPSHTLPGSGGYQAYITDLATRIADGLTSAT